METSDGRAAAAARDFTMAWTSRDGATITIRAIRESDFAMERAFIDALSYDTNYRRLLSSRRLRDTEIERFTHVDFAHEVALVAIDERGAAPTMCGVTRYVRGGGGDGGDDPSTAEWAIVIADAWQGRGLGRELLERLIALARDAGVKTLSDITLATNEPMRSLARKLGFTLEREPGDAMLTRMTMAL